MLFSILLHCCSTKTQIRYLKNNFKDLFLVLIVYMGVVHLSAVTSGTRGVIGNCEPPVMGGGNLIWVFCKIS